MTSSNPTNAEAHLSDEQKLAAQLEADLMVRHGPLMGGPTLHVALGYRSAIAFRSALDRNQISVKTFAIEFRRGKFALTKDVAAWLARQASGASPSQTVTRKD